MRSSIAFLGVLSSLACVSTVPVTPRDAEAMFTVGDLVEYGLELEGDVERFERRQVNRWFNGATEIEYEFDPGDERDDLPYVYSLAEIHPSADAACASFEAGNVGIWIAVDTQRRDELFRYGDRTRFSFIMDAGQPVGMIYNMCRSRTAYLLLLGGFYFDEPELFRSAVMPVLDALRRLEQAQAE